MKSALIVLAEGFEEIEAITVIDLLRRAGISVTVAGLSSATVKGARETVVQADTTLAAANRDFDALILPGGMPGTTNLSLSSEVIDRVRKAFAQERLVAAICAAPSVLGKAGILEGRRATCYPGVEEKLVGSTFDSSPVVIDGTIITSRGVGTAIQFALEIVAYLTNRELAHKVGLAILVEFK
jgi:protein deglycase